MEVAKEKFNSPSSKSQRKEMKDAAVELAGALKDWERFVEVMSSRMKFGPSEVGVISRVNQLLLDSMERY